MIPPRPALPDALLDAVRAAYRPPGRAYHDANHLDEVLRRYDEVAARVGWLASREVLLALLFHDAVYVPGRSDNEAESAALARRLVAEQGLEGLDVAHVEALILLTARHGRIAASELDLDAALFLDVDMAILGAEPAVFDAYARGIATEYAWLAPEVFTSARRAFLASLLAAPRIYFSPYFHDQLEARARANLTRALEELDR